MSFEIVIREHREVRKVLPKQWRVIGSEEIVRPAAFWEGTESQPRTRVQDVHGYTPEVETIVTEEVELLKQTVEKLDLAAVIKAVNSL